MGMGATGRLLASVATAVLVAGVIVLVTVFGSIRSAAAAIEQPNIIFVLTDDQFPRTVNAMPALRNNITSQGVKFTNMVSTFPLCCPGRATILRGQYAHNTHIYSNSLPTGGWEKFRNQGFQKSTVATWLNDAGYQTGLFGKYMNNYTSLDIPRGWDRWYAWNGPKEGWNALNDQGTQKTLTPQDADAGVSNAALKFLDARLGRTAPVFASVNFAAEHAPYHYAPVDADKFKGVGVPRTPAFNEANVSDKPPNVSNLPRLSDAEVDQMDQDYANGLRSLMRVDRFIREASDLLRSKGEMGNTYFVFYADNGDHFGQHRLPHGKLQPYKEDTNFPLIVRGPGIPHGAKIGKLVGNHDIAPTLARMGEASVPAFVDGRSFLSLAKDPSTTWPRTAILSEKEINLEPPNVWDMLRMEGSNYTRYHDGAPDNDPDPKEFYDLSEDPYQVHNAFSTSDTDPPANTPDSATQAYYEDRLDALYACAGQSCRTAENAPLLPPAIVP
jgi:N-acetylglucosamine-6-sulfatase